MKFLLFIFEFFNSAKNEKKSCNEASAMNMWCVNENVRSVNEKRMPTWKGNMMICVEQLLPQGKRNSYLNVSPERQLKQRYLLIPFTALGYWIEERLIKSLGFLECVVHLFEETINRYTTQDTIPNFNIFMDMGHLRHQTSIINPCKILVLQ